MPVLLLPFLPLTTVVVGMFVITSVKFTEFDCVDLVKDTLDGDICWCYENGGFGCCCCTVCHDDNNDNNNDNNDDNNDDDNDDVYDDSSDSFHAYAYAKKS